MDLVFYRQTYIILLSIKDKISKIQMFFSSVEREHQNPVVASCKHRRRQGPQRPGNSCVPAASQLTRHA